MKRARGLSRGEDALWRKATGDVRPLKKQSRRLPAKELLVGETNPTDMTPVRSRRAPSPAMNKTKGPRQSAFEAGDPALEKKARRGRIEDEADHQRHEEDDSGGECLRGLRRQESAERPEPDPGHHQHRWYDADGDGQQDRRTVLGRAEGEAPGRPERASGQ